MHASKNDSEIQRLMDVNAILESEATSSDAVSVIQPKDDSLMSGVFGTCDWDVDSDGTLTIHEGTLDAGAGNWMSYVDYIVNVKIDDGVIFNQDSSNLFASLTNVKTIDVTNADTSNVYDMSNMFKSCPVLTTISGIKNFDTSQTTNMHGMFDTVVSLKTLDLSTWDTSNVVDMGRLFAGDSALKVTGLNDLDTSQVTDMQYMFYNSRQESLDDIENWDVSKVENFAWFFGSCTKLTEIDLSNWDTSSATSMQSMFTQMSAYPVINMGGKFTTENVTNFSLMFASSNMETLDLSNFNTSKVLNMSWMFSNTKYLTTLLGSFDTSSTTSLDTMFSNSSLNDLSGLNLEEWDTSKCTNFSNMFTNTTFTNLDVVANFDFSKAFIISEMFSGCKNLTSIDVSKFDLSKVSSASSIFEGDTSLRTLDLSSWDTTNLDMGDALSGTDSLWKINLGPKTILSSNIGLVTPPGNDTEIFDDTTSEVYTNISDHWQTVLNGTDHDPKGPTYSVDDIYNLYANPSSSDSTIVWQQEPYYEASIEVPSVDFKASLPSAKGVVQRQSDWGIIFHNYSYPAQPLTKSIEVKVSSPLTSTEGNVLNDSLIFKKENGETVTLNDNNQSIFNGSIPSTIGDDGSGNQQLLWDDDGGLLLNLDGTQLSGDYQGTLDWTMVDSV
ncbi:hypothetical protein BTM29_01750 [Companilactobacillus allii]|uniref:BspA family leucine-rich repeat surface protein n=1 Tax=Companilactobacillus allii TaxID=1847728 RepID=A0A1P8Q0F2_9LACO|nr:hypothetical protein BTM29_01750 [Companilactobacillus allii]